MGTADDFGTVEAVAWTSSGLSCLKFLVALSNWY